MTAQTSEPATTEGRSDAVSFHWIMTVQANGGRQGTNDGVIGAIPGMHSQESTFTAVRKAMAEWFGTDNFTVVFYSLTPNQL